jgi:hypothetical protein
MPPKNRVDLKLVGQVFADILAAVREDDVADLEPQAIEYLKAARYKIMRQIEAACVYNNLFVHG